jgi:hypothetical protein
MELNNVVSALTVVFVALSGCLVFFLSRNLFRTIWRGAVPVIPANLSNRDVARLIVNAAYQGKLLRHILLNNGRKRNDEEYVASFKSFLNRTNVGVIKDLKGFESND